MITKKTELMAKQSLNAMYKDSVGAAKQEQIIKVFGSLWLPLAVISVAISTFSIYMDLSMPLGFTISLIIGLFFATILVIFTHFSLDSLFTRFTGLSKIMMGVIFVGLATISILTHFKSLNNFEKIMVQDKRVSILKMNMATSSEANEQIQKVLATNQALTKVFNNGTIHDDKTAMRSITSNNQLIALLKTTSSNQKLQDEIISEQKVLANTLKDTLFLLFIVLEILSYFSLVSKILLALNTSEEVKNLTTHLSKLEEIEANIYDTLIDNKTEQVTSKVNQVFQAINNSPTLPQNSYKQQNNEQIAFNANTSSNAYSMDVLKNLGQNWKNTSNLPSLPTSNAHFSGCHTQPSHSKEEDKEQKTTEEKKEVLDLMKFSAKDNEIIKAMYENGAVKEGDRLLSKRLVKRELEDNRLITKRDIDNCYEKLEELGFITFKGGYRAVKNMENVTIQA